MTLKPIVWTQEQHSWRGTVGGAHLFTYFWNSSQPKGEPADRMYSLRTTLPGIGGYRCKEREDCERLAQQLLERFVLILFTAEGS